MEAHRSQQNCWKEKEKKRKERKRKGKKKKKRKTRGKNNVTRNGHDSTTAKEQEWTVW